MSESINHPSVIPHKLRSPGKLLQQGCEPSCRCSGSAVDWACRRGISTEEACGKSNVWSRSSVTVVELICLHRPHVTTAERLLQHGNVAEKVLFDEHFCITTLC